MKAPDTSARKQPRQQRAKATVDAIVTACARILIEEGYEKLSTNQISRRAGVSPGTLYQYFPNKESIIAALIDSIADESRKRLSTRLSTVVNEPLPVAARTMVEGLVEMAQRVEPELVRTLIEQVPRLGKHDAIRSVRKRGLSLAKTYLEAHQSELRPQNLDAAAFVVVTSAEALTFRIAFERPRGLALAACIDETTDLFLRYLQA